MDGFQPAAEGERFIVYFRSKPIIGASIVLRGAGE